MSIREAIDHSLEKAKMLDGCNNHCAQEHLQLAEWLTDLLNLMENGYSHFTKEMDRNYLIFVSAAIQGRLAADSRISSQEAARYAIEDAKEVIRQLKLGYEYK